MFNWQLLALVARSDRRDRRQKTTDYRSPFGVPGAVLTVVISLVTIYFQLTDPLYQKGIIGVAIWYALTIIYFAAYGRKTLVYSPEEEFAVKQREGIASM
jgi:ethanolamine permease